MDKKNPLNQSHSAELVSLAEREALLRMHLGAFGLSTSDMAILVGSMREVTVNTGKVIVAEGDIIESIYLLAAGSAEVSSSVTINNKAGTMLLATLFEGDAIGLKGDNLFSETGFRTATVTALTPTILLELPLNDLQVFLESRPELLATIRSNSDWIMRMKLIKAATPFAKLNHQQLAGLASGVKEVQIKSNQPLFKQGEIAENCYLICSGQVEVTIPSEQGEHQVISILESPALVGEAAFLNFARYNATAQTLTDCTLLQMDKNLLLEVASSDPKVRDTLITLIKGHCRPVRQENIIYHHRTTADGQSITSLKNSTTNRYLQLSKEGWLIWTHLNGKLSISELTRQVAKEDSAISPDEVKTIIQKLVNSGFALIDAHQAFANENTPIEQKNSLMNRLFNSRYFFQKADKKIDFIYRHGGFLLFNILTMCLVVACILSGSLLFFKILPSVAANIKTTNNLFFLLLLVLFLSMTTQLLTPLIKALTIKHFNQEVPLFGIVWRGIGPVGIVDTSDMWLSSRKGQTAVSLSGILSNIVLAALFSSYAYYTSDPHTMLMSWLCALVIFLKTIRTLNPMLDLDGYELLCNVLDCPRLREHSLGLLSKKSDNIKTHKLELIFWSYTLVYLLSILAIVVLIFNSFIENQPIFSPINGLICVVFPLAFFLEIFLEIKNQQQWNSQQIL
jgi:CRP-like cAMP-binding protein